MAVFMINICKFNGCGITFQTLGDLIQHIEDNHIDYDPQVIEQQEQQQPQCMPLSYVLRFYTDTARKEVLDIKPKVKAIVTQRPIIQASIHTVTPNGSEVDDDEMMSDLEDSNDSWTTSEEFSSEFILRYGSKMTTPISPGANGINLEKPFACPVPGCKKRYKNVNGIKYHSKNGHKNDGKVRKGFKCHCGKSYKTGSGLKNHTSNMHNGANMTTLTTQTGEVLQVPSSQVTTIQPIRGLTLKQIASLGVPVKTLVVATKSPIEKAVKPTSPPPSSLGVLTPATSPQSPLPSPTPSPTISAPVPISSSIQTITIPVTSK
uniref:C2H2-type domain-containing protein n=1 Tax=Clastoptera arizonana TaxID=38151 RepID=A0A1B6BW75_9HEMI